MHTNQIPGTKPGSINWIGIKHVILYNIEKLLFLVVPCKHVITVSLKQDQVKEILAKYQKRVTPVAYCHKCDKRFDAYVYREYNAEELEELKKGLMQQ
jgi:hypothetical protein